MASTESRLDGALQRALLRGLVIPAHPLALDENRRLDEQRQRALTRYYCAAGAGGIAVGVHTTQFAIRHASVGLYEPVLGFAVATAREYEQKSGKRLVKVAGVCGRTAQAMREAELAQTLGYDLALLSLGALRDAPNNELIEHSRRVSAVLPIMGFYLQSSVGGRLLAYDFWRAFFEIENVAAVKVAPFNRYQTLDVVRALVDAGRQSEIALFTGNDDNIVADLLTDFRFPGTRRSVHFVGGLLGHWAVWTHRAVEFLATVRECHQSGGHDSYELLGRAAEITDSNAAFFDARNNFAGCIAGIHEVLRRQGLLRGRWCLDPNEDLSPGQMEEIDRVYAAYPQLNDDEFVAQHLDEWLR